ncbi:hypothetical protein E3P99_03289 [Wallemia hederae]|uniref:RWD domain-containing protein n=1 Tax=Wallemia hederae TaxID=1540922 RepID=A0A4T0FIS3_9BASI|nr:hypothetical protein E3P99_03289 [Wallemia hederae]
MTTSKTIDIPVDVREELRKFRFSRLKGISVLILCLEVQERLEDISLEELAEELPENAPRYVVISYPLKHPDGRIAVPLALINWKPTTSSPEMNTLHASGLSIFQQVAEVSRMQELITTLYETERETLATELEALLAIYGDDALSEFHDKDNDEGMIRVTVGVNLLEPHDEISISILISLPPTYPHAAPPQMQLLSKYIGSHGVDSALFGEILRSFVSELAGAQWVQDEPAIYNGIEDAREKCTRWYEDLSTRVVVGELQREEERENRLATNPQLIAQEKQLEEEAILAASMEHQLDGLPEGLEIITTPSVTYTKSTFAGHCVRISSPSQVPLILNHLQSDRKIARATHPVINAWRCKTDDGVQHQDNDDDGESAAGNRIAHLLSILLVAHPLRDVLVVVTRWYGGVHLGADRFKYINQVAREALELAGVLNDGDDDGAVGVGGKKAKDISRKKK